MPKSASSANSSPSSDAVRYLDTPETADAFLRELRDVRELALDTEGASFHRFVDRIYLLQLTARTSDGTETSAILDPLAVGPLPALGALLEDPKVEVVFHDADYDLRLLHQDYGWHPRPLFDTRIAAQLLGLRAFGLAALLEREFGVKLDKKHQRADWSMRPLTADMLDYAAQDTRFLPELRDRLRHQLEKAGRLAWAEEEFARLEGTRWAEEDPSQAFMRLKGARDLNRRELALLRELVIWRDGVAASLDRATFRVAGNEVLLEIARRAPRTKDELASIKGVPRGSLDARGGEMLDAVKRGLAVPDAELPRFPRAPRWDRDPDFDARVSRLRGVRDDAAQRLDLDPGVLLSRERLEAVARKNPKTPDELAAMPELRRWQVAELGPALLEGLRAVDASVAGRGGAAPTAPAPTAAPQPAAEPTDDRSPYRDA
ncbi:ribonuclease D [Roseisolibacter agri]|uniref:Ribonuclease D n=1 Tax=Roseisolibacter agri TaxID=2014610 RepID=A0AA37Q531_9BACT|nr:HRDC domain-containing protein [Roseisolibacter agri]GLC26750.1 ribonuclease D [Roseisolibacter agri]